jgi:uncharacterized protein (DUF1330 family)
MTHYAAIALTPTSEDWIPGYLETVTGLVQKHGGQYLARTASHERIEGEGNNPALMVIIEWPSAEAAKAFYSDPEYQPHLAARLSGADNHFFLIEGKDDFA